MGEREVHMKEGGVDEVREEGTFLPILSGGGPSRIQAVSCISRAPKEMN